MPDRTAALPNHSPRLALRSAPRLASRSAPRRKRRRHAAALACSLLGLTALTACGGSSSSSSSSSAASTPGRPVTITFWGWTRGSQQVADAFNASHHDVHVVFEQIPSGNAGGYAKISNAVKAGNEPDVFNVEYPMLPEYVSQGAVQDLTSRISGLTSKFTPQSVQLTTFAGKDWALPLDADPQVFFYRKDVFTKYGIQVPTTWDQFRTAAQKLKAADPAARLATFFSDDPSTLEAMAWQAGAAWFGTSGDAWKVGLRDAPTQKVAAYWQSLIADDLVRVQPYSSQAWSASLQNSQTVGYLGAAWSAGALKSAEPTQAGDWAVAPIPSWDGNPAGGMLGGSVFVVGKDSKNVAAAVEFSQWATTTPQGMQARIASGISSVYPADPALVPTAKQAFNTTFYGGQDIFSVFSDASAAIKPGWSWGPSMGVTNSAIKNAFSALTGSGTIDQALRAGQDATVSDLKARGVQVVGP
ncbi:ABC transporter substrate-binding protein [Catenulispora rubra]|uniref:ABC transporter substrate-binding protein n=1 Tax=Catenulispora rubra TaxID=280293 RepID=UPI00189222E2|nr:sugar ABC transporter substrate-binding protein [Catenulispora rubra]